MITRIIIYVPTVHGRPHCTVTQEETDQTVGAWEEKGVQARFWRYFGRSLFRWPASNFFCRSFIFAARMAQAATKAS